MTLRRSDSARFFETSTLWRICRRFLQSAGSRARRMSGPAATHRNRNSRHQRRGHVKRVSAFAMALSPPGTCRSHQPPRIAAGRTHSAQPHGACGSWRLAIDSQVRRSSAPRCRSARRANPTGDLQVSSMLSVVHTGARVDRRDIVLAFAGNWPHRLFNAAYAAGLKDGVVFSIMPPSHAKRCLAARIVNQRWIPLFKQLGYAA